MADTSSIYYKCSIYPIRDFSVDNFIYGYPVAESPIDNDSNYIPFNEQLYNKIVLAGLRPYRKFSDVGNVDLTEAIKSIVAGANVEVTDADIFNIFRDNVSLVKQDRILQENYFDCDNAVFDNIELTTLPFFKLSDSKTEKLQYFNTWSAFLNTSGNNYLDVSLDDGTQTPTYRFKRTGGALEWGQSWGNTNLVFQYDIEVDLQSGTETSKTKTAKRLIQNYLKQLSAGGFQGTADILGKEEEINFTTRKVSFGFSTKHQSYSDLKQFQTLTLNDVYGVLIYQDGETVTQDQGYGVTTADFSNCLFYGYCQIAGINQDTNEIDWNGYYYQTPKEANFMNYVKSVNKINNPSFDSNINDWTASGGATATYDSTNKRLQIGGLTNTTDKVRCYSQVSATFAGKQGLEFEIFNFSENATPATVHCRVELSGGDPFDVQITGNGKYSFINETGETSVGDVDIYFEVQSNGSGATAFDVDNVNFWELE